MALCLVTGGQGFIGSALVRNLVEEGHSVRVPDLERPAFMGLDVQGVLGEVELLAGDLASGDDLSPALAGADWVFHLGAVTLVGDAARDPVRTYRTNAQGTWMLLEAARITKPELVVVASSDKAYGPSPELPYREGSELRPVAPYEGSKAACDVIARSYQAAWGLPVAVTRLANVYGGGDLNFSRLVPELMASAVRGRDPGIRSDGTPRRDFLHVSDAVKGYRAVADLVLGGSGHGDAFNVGTGRPVAVAEVIEAASEVTGASLATRATITDRAQGEIDSQYVDPAKVRAATGWRAEVELEQGLREAFDWFSARPELCP